MDPALPSDRLEALLAHRDWVRRVARALVRDEDRADDLEQEAWLDAMRAGPIRSPRAWLGTVLRRVAATMRRGEGRRRAREAAAPGPPPPPDPGEWIERAEAIERVARAVRTLEEPYRTAVFLRWFEDLSPPEVAARLGVPLETVRTRLRRALAMLRERLDAGDGEGRRKWALLLLPLARRPAPAAPGAVPAGVPGGLLMTAKAKAGLAAAALLLLLGGGWLALPGDPPSAGNAPPAAAAAPVPPGPAPAPAAAPATAPEPEPAPVPGPVLVLDPDGVPVEGAVVEGLRIGRMGMEPSLPVPFPLGRTGAGGRLRWPEGDLPFPCILRASHGDFAPGEAVAIAREAEAVLRLRRGFAIEGSVADEGGAPVAGAAVGIAVLPASHVLGCQLGVTGSVAREGRSGPDGRFRVAGLPPAFQGIVSARAEGFQEGRVAWSAMDGRPPRVVLQRPFRSVVRVRDREGRPVDGASVWIFAGPRVRFGRWMPAEPEVLPLPAAGTGLYAREDLPAGWTSLLVARSGFRIVVREDAAFGRDLGPVEVVLEEVPGLRGRVVWGDTKEPVEGVKVRATPLRKVAPTARGEEAEAWYWPVSEMEGPFTAVTGKDGSYALPVFGPSDSLKIEARGEDGTWGSGSHPAYGERESATVHDLWLHRMRRDVDYSGRVVAPSGEPIPGALVVGFADVATSGPDGRFRLVSRQPGAFVQVMAPGFVSRSPPVPGRSASGGGFGAQDLGDVVLPPLREVRGIVVDREGAPVPGTPLWAEPLGRMGLPADAQFSAAALGDSGGRFTIRLVPGHRYRVRVFDGSREGGAEVEGDAVEEVRVVVGPDPRAGAGGIRGRLVREDGAWEPRRLTVVLRPESGGSPGGLSGAVDPLGRFEVHGVPAGAWALRVAGSAEVEGSVAGVRVVPGAYAEVEVPCRVAAAEAAAPAEVRVRLEPRPGDTGPVRAFATRGSGPSEVLRAREDGTWGGTAKAGAPWRVWAMDPVASRAGVAAVEPGGAEAAVLPLVPAGTLSLPGWEFGTPEPWVEVRDASGAILYSGGITALPVVADRGNCLLLPPGPCTVEVSTGPERKDPRTLSGTAEAGRVKPLE